MAPARPFAPSMRLRSCSEHPERGIDIPRVNPDFQTDVPGVFIAGELGGMGLIRNAVEQGKQALQSIAAAVKQPHQNELDVVIVGAGPAGLSATLGAKESKLRYATLEQEELGGTVAHFPSAQTGHDATGNAAHRRTHEL